MNITNRLKRIALAPLLIAATLISSAVYVLPTASAAPNCAGATVYYGSNYPNQSYAPGAFCMYSNGAEFVFQGDGNLVSYVNGTPYFSSRTAGHVGSGGRFVLQTDGNMVIYNSGGTPIWASHTNFGGRYNLTLATGPGSSGAAQVFSYTRNTTVWRAF